MKILVPKIHTHAKRNYDIKYCTRCKQKK